MPHWIPVCRPEDIPVLGARRLSRPQGLDVALFRTADGHIYALLDRCPHKGGPLSQGLVAGHTVSCPLHGWNIELASGCAQAPDEGCTPRFAVRIEQGQVWLDGEELAHHATDATRPLAGPAWRAACRPAEEASAAAPAA